jgi:hypothetical protein
MIHCSDARQTAAQMEGSLDEHSASLPDLLLHPQPRNLAQVSGMRLRNETTVEDVRRKASERPLALAPRDIAAP